MSTLFFNLSFDLAGIALIMFVIWFFINFNNPAAAFKWFSLSILALLASIIILSYGSTKLSRVRFSLPTQNQTEITELKHRVNVLKNKTQNKKKSSTTDDHSKNKSTETAVPSRIVNSNDNEIVKNAITKHKHHINLVAKVTNSSPSIMLRGVHSSQIYQVSGSHDSINVGEFVVAKGMATSVKNGVINLHTTSIHKQN